MENKKFIWFASMVFFSGFFIGYTLRLLDVVKGPVLGFASIYPIHREAMYAMQSFGGYGNSALPVSKYEMGILDVLKSNIVPAVAIIASGVLICIPSVILLFVIGMVSGSSLAEILEFTPIIMNIKVGAVLAVFTAAMIFSASSGFHIGSSAYFLIKEQKIRIEKSFYDHMLIGSALVIFGIILQYVLLVM